jgi:hypothetical protein
MVIILNRKLLGHGSIFKPDPRSGTGERIAEVQFRRDEEGVLVENGASGEGTQGGYGTVVVRERTLAVGTDGIIEITTGKWGERI